MARSASLDKAPEPTSDEKSTPPGPAPRAEPPKRRFFGGGGGGGRSSSPKARAVDGKGVGLGGGPAAIALVDDVAEQQQAAVDPTDDAGAEVLKPVGLLALFRYSSRSERFLMVAGLVASGSSRPTWPWLARVHLLRPEPALPRRVVTPPPGLTPVSSTRTCPFSIAAAAGSAQVLMT
jgi:hypothetical protein